MEALRNSPIAFMEVAFECEPLSVRKGERTILARGQGNSFRRSLAENFSTARDRIKKTLVLSIANDFTPKYMPLDLAPLPVQLDPSK
ncbi:hypothetical protein PoB_000857800 [Plakobranchus ocellatus]|uniref:Uncharacterized protein n=1 Tax=Plakobranchus ocellatus TaxID=259542 RepID=A0AAV3YIN2_9GAST|nr:hypothetical protein PoB_000857800 [Plakobranchus ocellatus]